jgi:type II secretory pathway component HofQ
MGVLGWLFKSQSKIDNKNELLIFMTPRIVKLEQKTAGL